MKNISKFLCITTIFLISSIIYAEDVNQGKAAVILDVSRHAFIQNEKANFNGVYPVRITWKKPVNDNPVSYHIQRSLRSGTGFSQINTTALPANGPFNDFYFYDAAEGIYTYIDRNETATAGIKYYYRIINLNRQGENFPSNEKVGWGALTHEKFFYEFNKSYASAIYNLTLMHKPRDLNKLGTEIKYGTISGQIYYNARIQGFGGDITVTTTNYCDFYIENDPAKGPYFILNGDSGSTANMSGNGMMKPVTITCTGMYPGTVFHGNVVLRRGTVAGGTYGVTPEGFPRAELSYTLGYLFM